MCGEFDVPVDAMRTKGVSDLVNYVIGRMRRSVSDHNSMASIEYASTYLHANIHDQSKGTSNTTKRKHAADQMIIHKYQRIIENG